MNKLIRLIAIIAIFSSVTVFADNIQVFTTNTMHLTIDKTKKLEIIYSGEKEEFMKEASSLLNSDLVKNAAASSVLSATASAGVQDSFKGLDANGGLVGVAVIGVITAGILSYDYISKSKLFNDSEYVFVAKAKNANNKETLIFSYIISNNELTKEEIKAHTLKDLK